MNNKISPQLLAMLITAVIAIPMTTQAIFRSIDDEGKWVQRLDDLRPAVQQYQSTQWRAQRRLYSRAVEIYRDLLRQGVEGILRPDINDVDSILTYIDQERFNAYLKELNLHGAPTGALIFQEVEQLPYQDQQRLWGYVNSGYCHPSMRMSYLHGFYELCERLLDHQTALRERPTSRRLGARSSLRASPPDTTIDWRSGIRGIYFNETAPQQSIKLRLQMMEQARDRSNRRADNPQNHPLWPTFQLQGDRTQYSH